MLKFGAMFFQRQWNIISLFSYEKNKHLMTGLKGNSEFISPRPFKLRGTLGIEGKQNSMFFKGPVIKCFVIPPNSTNRTNQAYTREQGVEIRPV